MEPNELDLATDEEPRPILDSIVDSEVREEEDTPAVEMAAEEPPPIDTDPVRLYFGEMGKVPLLTAAQEVEIGRRIEASQAKLQEALGALPLAVRALVQIGDRLRGDPSIANSVIVLADGGEPTREALAPIVRSFDRLGRWSESVAARRAAIQALVASLPLQPALVDDLVGRVREASAREAGGPEAPARGAARADRRE